MARQTRQALARSRPHQGPAAPRRPSKLVKETPLIKFDESIRRGCDLGVNAKSPTRSFVAPSVMPSGTGKTVRVAVFPGGEKVRRARPPVPTSSAWKIGREGPGRQPELRHRDRDPGCHAHRRYAGPDPRPARPDAESRSAP